MKNHNVRLEKLEVIFNLKNDEKPNWDLSGLSKDEIAQLSNMFKRIQSTDGKTFDTSMLTKVDLNFLKSLEGKIVRIQ